MVLYVQGFNKANVEEFFNSLEHSVDKYGLTATKFFNVVEMGFSTVQKISQKMLPKKAKTQVGAIVSGEQYLCCMHQYSRNICSTQLEEGAPAGCLVEISNNGYIYSDLFVLWLKHFVSAVKPSVEEKFLLLLDGYTNK